MAPRLEKIMKEKKAMKGRSERSPGKNRPRTAKDSGAAANESSTSRASQIGIGLAEGVSEVLLAFRYSLGLRETAR